MSRNSSCNTVMMVDPNDYFSKWLKDFAYQSGIYTAEKSF